MAKDKEHRAEQRDIYSQEPKRKRGKDHSVLFEGTLWWLVSLARQLEEIENRTLLRRYVK